MTERKYKCDITTNCIDKEDAERFLKSSRWHRGERHGRLGLEHALFGRTNL